MLTNNKLYNLLKNTLHLKDGCCSFKIEDFTTKAIPVEKFLEIAESCNKDSVFVIDSLTGVVN